MADGFGQRYFPETFRAARIPHDPGVESTLDSTAAPCSLWRLRFDARNQSRHVFRFEDRFKAVLQPGRQFGCEPGGKSVSPETASPPWLRTRCRNAPAVLVRVPQGIFLLG